MLQNDMNLSRLMEYSQSIEESTLSRISRNLKRSGSNEQSQPRFKKRALIYDGRSFPKIKGEGGSNCQAVKPTYYTSWKKHFGKCLVGIACCFNCGIYGHKVRYCPTIVCRGRETNGATPSVQEGGAPRKKCFYNL